MTNTDQPTIAERYATATETTTLKPTRANSSAGAVDVLMAAGMCREGLGTRLLRLRAEFDALASEIRGTGNNALTDTLLVLMQMRTLKTVKEHVGNLARQQAIVLRFHPNPDALAKLTGRVLNVFLDPNCWSCEGRGFTGGGQAQEPGPMVLCTPCKGSGRRNASLGRNEAERVFAAHLLALLEKSVDHAEHEMRRRLK